MGSQEGQQQHFLIVTYPAQGHVNPALHLASRLIQATGAAVTFSTAVSGHRRMFSSSEEFYDGQITYIPYSDGYDDGFQRDTDSVTEYHHRLKSIGSKTLSDIVTLLASRGRPVTLIIYTFLLSWVGVVARDHAIPSALYWIQPATVFSIYFRYFHGYAEVIASKARDPLALVELPGLFPLRVRDLPSFLTTTRVDDPYAIVTTMLGELFEFLNSCDGQSVLVNTFDELERDALNSIDSLKLIGVGPLVAALPADSKLNTRDLFESDKRGYMEWLDSKADNTVVYVSFGSFCMFDKHQIEEIQRGLKESGRPYLWVVRKDNRELGVELEESGDNGMIVEWCSQVKVLSHPAVGCFVTHCGWNSTLETLACGVPVVAVPQWTDQGTNARLMEEWGIGVRGEVENGVLMGAELKRCLDIVNDEKMRQNAMEWKEKASQAVKEGGSSDRNLKMFLEQI